MDKPEIGDPKAKARADREKFKNIEKVELPVLTIKSRPKGQRNSKSPELKSPDEQNPKWIPDPEEAMAERKAKARAAKRSKDEA